MWRWILKLRGEHGVVITIFMFLVVCSYVSYPKHQTTSSGGKKLHTNNTQRQFQESSFQESKPFGIRLRRRHANFRQTRFIGVKVKRREKVRTSTQRLANEKINTGANFKRKVLTKPRVIIKKHAMFRQKKFVQPRRNKQMGKTYDIVNHKRIVKNQWLSQPQQYEHIDNS